MLALLARGSEPLLYNVPIPTTPPMSDRRSPLPIILTKIEGCVVRVLRTLCVSILPFLPNLRSAHLIDLDFLHKLVPNFCQGVAALLTIPVLIG